MVLRRELLMVVLVGLLTGGIFANTQAAESKDQPKWVEEMPESANRIIVVGSAEEKTGLCYQPWCILHRARENSGRNRFSSRPQPKRTSRSAKSPCSPSVLLPRAMSRSKVSLRRPARRDASQ